MKTLSALEANQVAGGVINSTVTFGPTDMLYFYTDNVPVEGVIIMIAQGAYFANTETGAITTITSSNCKQYGFSSFQSNGGGKFTYTLA